MLPTRSLSTSVDGIATPKPGIDTTIELFCREWPLVGVDRPLAYPPELLDVLPVLRIFEPPPNIGLLITPAPERVRIIPTFGDPSIGDLGANEELIPPADMRPTWLSLRPASSEFGVDDKEW